MYIDNTKLFIKTENRLKILIQAITIFSQDIGIEFGIEICTRLKITSIWKYWKRTP